MKHTPGPWEIYESHRIGSNTIVQRGTNYKIAVASLASTPRPLKPYKNRRIGQFEMTTELSVSVANARLIASSPDLLKKLEFARKELKVAYDQCKSFIGFDVSQAYENLKEIDSTIKVAKGEK